MQDNNDGRIKHIHALPVELVLDQYLAPFEQELEDSSSSSNSGGNVNNSTDAATTTTTTPASNRMKFAKRRQQKQDEILKAVDFLYGNTLEGALSILDAAETSGSITQMLSIPSRRSLYLVKGSASYRGRSNIHSGSNNSMLNSAYLCLLPRPTDDLPIYYCSCRSFLERSRSVRGSGEGSCLCKHLLAIRLMKVLGVKPLLQETMSDTEFASSVLQCISID